MNDKKQFGKVPSMFSLDSDKPEAKNKPASNGNLEQEYLEPYSAWSGNQTPKQNDMIIEQ